MTLTTTAAGSGAVLGGVGVLLLQQFGLLDLSELEPAAIALVVGVAVGAVVCGLIGWAFDRR